ncbi:MAG: hypothetical protein P8Z75_09300 [Gammaproteobacteria bacterium]
MSADAVLDLANTQVGDRWDYSSAFNILNRDRVVIAIGEMHVAGARVLR